MHLKDAALECSLPDDFGPNRTLARWFGGVPALFRCQARLPDAIDAEVRLIRAATARRDPLSSALLGAVERLLHTIASGLDASPAPSVASIAGDVPPDAPAAARTFELFESEFGFVPGVFRAQAGRPDALDAEAFAIHSILLADGALSRRQKECIGIAIAAADRNAYWTVLRSQSMRILGIDEQIIEQIVLDPRHADIPDTDKILIELGVAVAGGTTTGEIALDRLRGHGVSDPQVVEAVVASAFSAFFHELQQRLGTPPDFDCPYVFPPLQVSGERDGEDPDAALVAEARDGGTAAFEELVRRHHRRVLRAAFCVTGQLEDAEDAAQVAFVKAFQGLAAFERQARFTTWLTRIAINEAITRVRARRPVESLSSAFDDREDFRPSDLGTWVDNPEQLYERGELRLLIERALDGMPVKYRLPVLLRDVEQLPTADAASALGVPVPTLKKRLLKGRLMLREALAPHFSPQHGVAGV